MSKAYNVIHGGFADLGSISAYSSLQGSRAISPAQNQVPIPPPVHQNSDADQLTISPEGRDAQARLDLGNLFLQLKQKRESELTPELQQLIEKYKTAERGVSTHETARLEAAGNLVASGANWNFVTGSEGVRYAVAGHGQIDTSSGSDNPFATLQKAQQSEQSALSPAQSSPQDFHLAAQTDAMAARSSVELLQRTKTQLSESGFANQTIKYSHQTEPTPPMWVDIFV